VVVLGATPGVAVVELATRAVVASYPYPGGGEPHGMVFDAERMPSATGLTRTDTGDTVSGRRFRALPAGLLAPGGLGPAVCRGRQANR
jgi:hypothetical protein